MTHVAQAMVALRYSLRCKAVRLPMFALLGIGCICLAVAGAWWLPAQHEHAQLEHDIAARRASITDAARAAELVEAHSRAVGALALLEKKLGAQAGQAEVIQDIARLALRRGVRVVSQSFDEGRAQHKDGALYLNLGVTGSYPSLRQLLGDFASLPVWLEVVEAHIERATDGGSQIRAQLRLLTYRMQKGKQL